VIEETLGPMHTYEVTKLFVDGEEVALTSATLFASQGGEWDVVALSAGEYRLAKPVARVRVLLSDGRSLSANVQQGVTFLGISKLPESIAGRSRRVRSQPRVKASRT
jgi:hypothetical protein